MRSKPMNTGPTYRPDIDGLRAIAVLSVILYHLNERIIPGGFVGVDIFFVISGYLITFQVLRDLESNRFSLLEFYRRRIKRIVPALLPVIFLTIVVSQVIFLPQDAEKVAESGLWSLLSLANVYFWLFEDTSYFAAASHEKPLLHLWSLGVEEQFYIIWPVILLLICPFINSRYFLYGLGFTAILSFAAGDILYADYPSFVYYMLPTRAGELLLGGGLAYYLLSNQELKPSQKSINLLSSVGFGLITISLITLSEDGTFPGFRAIPPTFGATLIIFSGHYGTSPVFRLLSMQTMVWVGLISYSAYLWHWPLIAFYRYGFTHIDFISGTAIFILTMLLAYVSFRFLETPLRHSNKSFLKVLFSYFLIPTGATAVIAVAAMKFDGYGLRALSEEYRVTLEALRDENRPAYYYDYVCQTQVVTRHEADMLDCVINVGLESKIDTILWGDSNAAHYIGIIGSFARDKGFSFRNLQVGSCPPIYSEISEFVDAKRLEDCKQSLPIIFETLDKYQNIIVSASWTSYQSKSPDFIESFFETAKRIASKGKNLIIIGKAPIIHSYDRLCREKSISYPLLNCEIPSVPLDANVIEMNKRLADFANQHQNISYFDINKHLCPSGICDIRDKTGKLIYFDAHHLAMNASWRIGEYIVSSKQIPAAIRNISNPSN